MKFLKKILLEDKITSVGRKSRNTHKVCFARFKLHDINLIMA